MLCNNIVAEVQLIFSKFEHSENSHTNHKLYEIKRCLDLEGMSKAIRRISTAKTDADISPHIIIEIGSLLCIKCNMVIGNQKHCINS